MDSILQTVKKLLGITEQQTEFDVDLIVLINSAFSTLRQLGVGPEEGFVVEDDDVEWVDFIGEDYQIEMVKQYVVQKVRLAFDPPSTSFVIDSIQKSIDEIGWRLCAEMDERRYDEKSSGQDKECKFGGRRKNQNGKFF